MQLIRVVVGNKLIFYKIGSEKSKIFIVVSKSVRYTQKPHYYLQLAFTFTRLTTLVRAHCEPNLTLRGRRVMIRPTPGHVRPPSRVKASQTHVNMYMISWWGPEGTHFLQEFIPGMFRMVSNVFLEIERIMVFIYGDIIVNDTSELYIWFLKCWCDYVDEYCLQISI